MGDKFKWTKENTSLLISVWSDSSVQRHFETTPRNLAIWNGISRYMRKRGVQVTWLQCRNRIKRLMMRYRKIKRGAKLKLQNTADQFFSQLDKIIKKKPYVSNLDSSCDVSNEATSCEEEVLQKPKNELPRPRPMPKISSGAQSSARPSARDRSRHKPATETASIKSEVFEIVYEPMCSDEEVNANSLSQSDITTVGDPLEASTSSGKQQQRDTLHCRMDLMLNKLNQIIPFTHHNASNTLETKVELALSQLERTSPIASDNITSRHTTLESKMGIVLERLEHIIPLIEHYSSSLPFLVDKIDQLLAGLDKMPYMGHDDIIEISTTDGP